MSTREVDEPSADERVISEAVERALGGNLITPLQARVIASQWHSGQVSALYSLASCGAIREDCAEEVSRELRVAGHDDAAVLAALLLYVVSRGVRGPVTGWANLSW